MLSARASRFVLGRTRPKLLPGGQLSPKIVDARPPAINSEAYADWINRRIALVVQRLRHERGWSAYRLGREAGNVTDQTILNIEQLKCSQGPLTGTLARVCRALEITMTELMAAVESEP
jgi:DNA-binding Xre family transcriptional regulator